MLTIHRDRRSACKDLTFRKTRDCGGVLGPPCFGYIVDISGSYKWAWLSLVFLAALCVLLILFVKERKRMI